MVLFFALKSVGLVGCGWLVCDETDENRKPDGFDDILPTIVALRPSSLKN